MTRDLACDLTCDLACGADLPGRNRAGSIRSGLLVAPITYTSCDLFNPSSSANSCDTILNEEHISVTQHKMQHHSDTNRSMTPPESPDFPRLGAMESNSSKKMTHGDALCARVKTEEEGV